VAVVSDGGELVSVISESSLSTSQVALGVRIYFHAFFNFDIKWRWVVVFTHRPLNFWVKILRYPLNTKMAGPRVFWTI